MVVEKGWSGVTLAKNGTAYFKKSYYHLKPACCRLNPHVEYIYIYGIHTPIQAAGGRWQKFDGLDIAGRGDVGHTPDWPSKTDLESMKRHVEAKNWHGVTLGKEGVGGPGGGAWFKKLPNKQLEQADLKPN